MICSTQYPMRHQHAWATNQSHSFTFQNSYDNTSKFNRCPAGWANSLPLSIASIRASVSLLRIQSISCRCERSPALSSRRRPAMWPDGPPAGIAPDLGRALRPSNSSTSSRSTSLVVSSTHLHNQPHNIIHQSLLSPASKFLYVSSISKESTVMETISLHQHVSREDAMDRSRRKKLIKIGWWSGWWVGECFFWYWLTRVVPDKGT